MDCSGQVVLGFGIGLVVGGMFVAVAGPLMVALYALLARIAKGGEK